MSNLFCFDNQNVCTRMCVPVHMDWDLEPPTTPCSFAHDHISQACKSSFNTSILYHTTFSKDFITYAKDSINYRRSPRSVVATVLNSDVLASDSNPSVVITFTFEQIPFGKAWTPLSPKLGLNSATSVLEGWFWHWITHEVWYAIISTPFFIML